jgi:hypothetical protein
MELWWRHQIPLQEAALIAYEAAERAGALDLIDSAEVGPEHKLDHFKFACMVDDEITLFGAKPPSRVSMPIPRSELSGLRPIPGESRFNYITPFDRTAYTSVTISRRDLRCIIRRYAPQVAQLKKQWGLR